MIEIMNLKVGVIVYKMIKVILLFSLFTILLCSSAFAEDNVVLNDWKLLQGDLPVDSNGTFEFEDKGQELWTSVELDKKFNYGNDEVYWLKAKIQGELLESMYLFFTTSGNDVEIYMDGIEIHSYGDFQQFRRSIEFVSHKVPLPYNTYEKAVFFRVHNDFASLSSIAKYTGFTNYFSEIKIDTMENYQQYIIKYSDNSEKYLGYIFVFLGLTALFISFMIKEQRKAILYFSGFTFCGGLYLVTYNKFVFGSPVGGIYTNYILTIGLYLLPFFVCGFVIEYFNIHKNRVFSFFYWILLTHVVIILVLDILEIAPTPLFFYIFLIVALIAVLYIMLSLIKLALKGDRNAKVVIGGFLIASILWIFELYKWIATPEYFANQHMLNVQWGILIFSLSIGYVLIYRYIDSHKRVSSMNKELMKVQEDMIITLGEIVAAHSSETGEHVSRVADISVRLAAKYGLKGDDLELIKLASPLHDIGKIAIPDEILNKRGPLSKDEFDIVKTHARIGYEILISNKQKIIHGGAIIALQHHEKYDGTGYPDNLKGEEIHIFARITAIADVFDALISDRVYKRAYTIPEAIEMMQKEKGRHFDPVLVDLFMEVVEELFFEKGELNVKVTPPYLTVQGIKPSA